MAEIIPCADPHVVPIEAKRLTRQSQQVLDALRAAPARTCTNMELAKITPRFGARIHDCRKAGYRIEILSRDHASGLVWYALRPWGGP